MSVDVRSLDGGHQLLTMSGVLDAATYRTIRDHIVKAALEEPQSVIVDTDNLLVPADSAWSVFTCARWLIDDWPGVPLSLVCGDQARRRLVTRCGVTRYVPVYASASSACVRRPQRVRSRARLALPASPASVRMARGFVTVWLTRWHRPEMIPAAKVVVTELVENVLAHTVSEPRVRLETDGSIITIAVEDDNPDPAALREELTGPTPMGLRIVGALSTRWCNAPTQYGKVVWAALTADDRI